MQERIAMHLKSTAIIGLCIALAMGSAVFADDQVMFNYQGRVRVQGTAFNGTGYFKFAIVNNAGNVTLWSNDGTSVGGGEPVASIAVDVVEGIFNVMIGDPDLGMEPMNRSIFNHPNQIKLRIWFSDGTHGFQQLLPDRRIVNPQLIGLVSGTEDFTIYVNGTTGNDENNGLTTDTAKQTIQAAVDVLPERLRCNVTIDIADGVYREQVNVFGISAEPQKTLTLLGDEIWTPSSPSDPSVRITGTDSDTSPTGVRDFAICAESCGNLQIKGVLFDHGAYAGASLENGRYFVFNCKAADNYYGFRFCADGIVQLKDCLAQQNEIHGFWITKYTHAYLYNCVARNNAQEGLSIRPEASVYLYESGEFSNNGKYGISVTESSMARFIWDYSGQINDNGEYGIYIRYDSYTWDHTRNTFSNNGLGSVFTGDGGHAY
jgi:hypothetical protein